MAAPPAWNTVLRALREARGASQEGWATRLGYSRRTLVRWEQGVVVPDAAAEAALIAVCEGVGLLRSYTQGPLAGLSVTPALLHTLLAEARLAAAAAAAVPSATPTVAAVAPLPTALSSFVGRAEDLAALSTLITQHRLVTLTGPGGIGKTRLAVEVAQALVPMFADGVVFVDLAPLRDPDLVPFAIAQALGIPETPSQPLLDSLYVALQHATRLLVLDNFEHVGAAALTVSQLLQRCARVQVLVTSRVALHL